jgi:hypothetical protein
MVWRNRWCPGWPRLRPMVSLHCSRLICWFDPWSTCSTESSRHGRERACYASFPSNMCSCCSDGQDRSSREIDPVRLCCRHSRLLDIRDAAIRLCPGSSSSHISQTDHVSASIPSPSLRVTVSTSREPARGRLNLLVIAYPLQLHRHVTSGLADDFACWI